VTDDKPSIDAQVRALAEPKIMEAADRARAAFMAQFGDFVEAAHKDELEEKFRKAGECKIKALLAEDRATAEQYAEAAELHMKAIETLGIGAKIVAQAKSASVIRETANIILDTLGDVALAVIKTIASGLVSGVIQGLVGGEGGVAGEAGTFPG
jgi:hypothetical protein